MFIAESRDGQRYCSFEEEEHLMRSFSQSKSLLCPECATVVKFRAGTKKPHFAHHTVCTNPNPYSEPESETHRTGKILLYTWLKGLFPKSEVHLEFYLSETKQRSDIMVLHPDGEKWAFEFQCSKIVGAIWSERHELYKSAHVRDYWILNHEIARSDDEEHYKIIGLESTIYSSFNYLSYLNVRDQMVTLLVDGNIYGSTLFRPKVCQSSLEHVTIRNLKLWMKDYEEHLEYLKRVNEERRRLEEEQAREEAAIVERERLEVEKKQRDKNTYYRQIIADRSALTKGMTEQEKDLFIRLAKKYSLNSENFPGLFHLDVKYSQLIVTPRQLWQLWVFDDIISQWGYFVRKKKDPKIWLDNTKNRFMNLKQTGILRIKYNAYSDVNYIFTFYNFIEKLNDAEVLQCLGSMTKKYQRLLANRIPLFPTSKENALLKMYFEGYDEGATILVGQQFLSQMSAIRTESKSLINSVERSTNKHKFSNAINSPSFKNTASPILDIEKRTMIELATEITTISKHRSMPLNLYSELTLDCHRIIRSYFISNQITVSEFNYLQRILQEAKNEISS